MDRHEIAPLLALALALTAAGCGSDSVAPHAEMPQLTQIEVARQTALLAAGVHGAAEKVLRYGSAAPGKDVYEIDLGTELLVGKAIVDVRCGGAAGSPCAEDDPGADWMQATGTVTIAAAAAMEIDLWLSFEFVVDPYDPVRECGTIGGQGVLVAGAYTSTFSLSGVAACADCYPSGGWVALEGGNPRPQKAASAAAAARALLRSARVDYDGTDRPPLVAGQELFRADLEHGELLRDGS